MAEKRKTCFGHVLPSPSLASRLQDHLGLSPSLRALGRLPRSGERPPWTLWSKELRGAPLVYALLPQPLAPVRRGARGQTGAGGAGAAVAGRIGLGRRWRRTSKDMLWPPDIWVLGRRRLKPGAGGGDPTPMSAGFLTHPASAGGAEVLFAGDWRVEERSLASIARHLVHPLKATVLAVLSASPRGSDHEVNRTRGSKAARAVQAKGVLKRFFPALAGRGGRREVAGGLDGTLGGRRVGSNSPRSRLVLILSGWTCAPGVRWVEDLSTEAWLGAARHGAPKALWVMGAIGGFRGRGGWKGATFVLFRTMQLW